MLLNLPAMTLLNKRISTFDSSSSIFLKEWINTEIFKYGMKSFNGKDENSQLTFDDEKIYALRTNLFECEYHEFQCD